MSVTSAEPVPTEDTACVGLIGAAERAAAAEFEALEAGADDEAGLHVAPFYDVARGKHAVKALRWTGPRRAVEKRTAENTIRSKLNKHRRTNLHFRGIDGG